MAEQIIDQDRWGGVCGFVGVLNALHRTNAPKEFGKELTVQSINERIGAEIITYLKNIEQGKPELAKEILKFTEAFGEEYRYGSISNICEKLREHMTDPDFPKTTMEGFGVAMTPNAIVDYVKFTGLGESHIKNTPDTLDKESLLQQRHCIVGLGKKNSTLGYNGLLHWVYVSKEGNLFNWGKNTHLSADLKELPDGLSNELNKISVSIQLV